MIYRRIDADGDYTFGQGKYNFLKETEAIGQAVKTRVLLLYSEWWEDLENGTPLFESILRQQATPEGKSAIDMIVKERILGVEEVIRISSFESRFSAERSYSAEVSVETRYGIANDIEIQLGV